MSTCACLHNKCILECAHMHTHMYTHTCTHTHTHAHTHVHTHAHTHTQLARRDEEHSRLRAELLSMGQQRQVLEQQVEMARARVQALEASQGAKEEEIAQLHVQIEGLMADLEQCSSLLIAAKEKEEEYEMGFSQHCLEIEAQKMSEERKVRVLLGERCGWAVGKKGRVLLGERGGCCWEKGEGAVGRKGRVLLGERCGWAVGRKGRVLLRSQRSSFWSPFIFNLHINLI